MKITSFRDLTPGRGTAGSPSRPTKKNPAVNLWQKHEDQFIKLYAGTLYDWQIADRLGRAPCAVRSRASQLKISLRVKK